MAPRTRRTWNPQKWLFFPIVMCAFCGVIVFMMIMLMNQQVQLKLTAENPTVRLGPFGVPTVPQTCSANKFVIGVVLETLDQDAIIPWIKWANQMQIHTTIFGDTSYEPHHVTDLQSTSRTDISFKMWKYWYERYFRNMKPDPNRSDPIWFVQVSEHSFVRPDKLVEAICGLHLYDAFSYECDVTILNKEVLIALYSEMDSKCNTTTWNGDITQCFSYWKHAELNLKEDTVVCGSHIPSSSKDWAIQSNIDFSQIERHSEDFYTCKDVNQQYPNLLRGMDPQKRRVACERSKDSKVNCPPTRITMEHINDNYCDCPDGSDEYGTSACVNSQVKFWCKNGEKQIFNSFVNDGFPDCSDHSDEYATEVIQ